MNTTNGVSMNTKKTADELTSLRVQVSELYSQVDELYQQTQALTTLVRVLLDYEGLHMEKVISKQKAAQHLLRNLLASVNVNQESKDKESKDKKLKIVRTTNRVIESTDSRKSCSIKHVDEYATWNY